MHLPLSNPLRHVDPVTACAPYRPLQPSPDEHSRGHRTIITTIAVIVAILALVAWFYVTISISDSSEKVRVTETGSGMTDPSPR